MARRLPIPNGRLDGALDANGMRIVNLMDPMSGDDAATKKYVDEKASGGGGGTSDYNDLENKPRINGHELDGDSTLDQIGAQRKLKAGANVTIGEDGTISATGGGGGSVKSVAKVKPSADGDVPLTADDIGALRVIDDVDNNRVVAFISANDHDGVGNAQLYVNADQGHVASVNVGDTPYGLGRLSVAHGGAGGYGEAFVGNLHGVIRVAENFGVSAVKIEGSVNETSVTDASIEVNGPNASIRKNGNEVATEEQVCAVSDMAKYPVVMKSGSVVMLEDRKVNVYSGTLSSDVTLVLPAANEDGRVRDLEFRANVSGLRIVGVRRTDASAAAVALVSMSPESASAEEGVNAWYFTETGGEVRMERALLKPVGYQVKMDFTCSNASGFTNDVDFLDSAGEKIKSIKFKDQKISEIVSGVASLSIGMSNEGSVVINGTTYYAPDDKRGPVVIALTGDSVITSSWADKCLTPDTPILTPSGHVALKDIRVGDEVLGVDRRGILRTVKVTRCDTHLEKWAGACDRWTFRREDGGKVFVTTVKRHRFYNVERGEMVYMDEWAVGEHGRDSDGCDLELLSHEHVDEPTRHMTLFTETQTYFAHGLLSGNRHTPHINWEDM